MFNCSMNYWEISVAHNSLFNILIHVDNILQIYCKSLMVCMNNYIRLVIEGDIFEGKCIYQL